MFKKIISVLVSLCLVNSQVFANSKKTEIEIQVADLVSNVSKGIDKIHF